MTSVRRTLAACVLVTLLTTPARAEPTPAAAPSADRSAKREPSAGDFATARAALREGLALREKGELPEAFARLASAYDLVPTPVTGFELGKTHLMLGHVLQAHELFKKVLRMPPSMEESTRSQTSRDEAERLAKQIEPRIPSLRIKLQLMPGAIAVVSVDDAPITTSGTETVRAVDPGPHDVVAKAGDGPEEKIHVEVAESETKDVVLSPQWVKPKNPVPRDGAPPDIFVRTTNPLVFIGFGIGAAAALTSGVTAYFALKERDSARDLCGRDYCPPRTDTQQDGEIGSQRFTDASNAAGGLVLVSVVTGLTAVLFVGVGFLGLQKPIKERVVSTLKLQPAFGMTSFGMVGSF